MKKNFMLVLLIMSLNLFAGSFHLEDINGKNTVLGSDDNLQIIVAIEKDFLDDIPVATTIYFNEDNPNFTHGEVYICKINNEEFKFVFLDVYSGILASTKNEIIEKFKKSNSVKVQVTDDNQKVHSAILDCSGFTKEYNKLIK